MLTDGNAVREVASSVSLEGVAKRFEAVTAVHDLNLTIEPGQFVTLLGPSGCGKSTTLNMIAGLEYPSTGTIRIGARDVTAVPTQERDVAMVFQSYALYPHLTVFDNIAFPLRARRRRTAPEQIAARVDRAARILGLEALLDRMPRQLSGGQRQRVALGRAMVRTPTVYLLDEPLSNLDQQLRVQMRSELKDLHARLGATMVYVTHDQGEAMVLSDRIAVLRDGSLQQFGAPLDLYRRPTNLFVARFLGEPGMNVFDGDLTREQDGDRFSADSVTVTLAHPLQPLSTRISLGVRPEDLTVARSAEAPIRGTVQAIEILGPRATLRASVGTCTVTAVVPADTRAVPGESIGLEFVRPDVTHWFDTTSGRALPVPGGPRASCDA